MPNTKIQSYSQVLARRVAFPRCEHLRVIEGQRNRGIRDGFWTLPGELQKMTSYSHLCCPGLTDRPGA